MALILNPGAPDKLELQNGFPSRMMDWMDISTKWGSGGKPAFVRLTGECIGFYADSTFGSAIDIFDLFGAKVDYPNPLTWSMLRIMKGRRSYYCRFRSPVEANAWMNALLYASQRSFSSCYVLGAIFAKGSTSNLHYTYSVEDDETVYVVKVTKRNLRDGDSFNAMMKERFVNTCLNHPKVVKVRDVFGSADRDYIVMDLKRGGSLEDLLAKHGPLSESCAKEITLQVAIGLHHLHSKGIVHRDIRPGNILFSSTTGSIDAAIGDFGSSEFFPASHVNSEKFTKAAGVPPYVAMEIVLQQRHGIPADLWSLGVVLYEMLSGESPFPGSTRREVLQRISEGTISFKNEVWKSVSNPAKSLLMQLFQPNQKKRISALAVTQHSWVNPVYTLSPQAVGMPSTNPALEGSPAIIRGRKFGHAADLCIANAQQEDLESMHSSGRGYSFPKDDDPMEVDTASSSMPRRYNSKVSQDRITSALAVAHPKIRVSPSVKDIATRGLHRVASENPGRYAVLSQSAAFQRQLSCALTLRRKFIVISKAFIFVLRLQSIVNGFCKTYLMPELREAADPNAADRIDKKRKKILDDIIEAKQERAKRASQEKNGS